MSRPGVGTAAVLPKNFSVKNSSLFTADLAVCGNGNGMSFEKVRFLR